MQKVLSSRSTSATRFAPKDLVLLFEFAQMVLFLSSTSWHMSWLMTKCLQLLQARKKYASLTRDTRGWKAWVETGGQLLPNSIGGSHMAEAGGARRCAGGREEHLLGGDQSRRRRSRSPALGTSWRDSPTISTYHFIDPITMFIFSIYSCTQRWARANLFRRP